MAMAAATPDAGAGAGAGVGAREDGVKVILLDIEGTVCPISFVKDVLFPYALTALTHHLSTPTFWTSAEFTPYRSAFPAPHDASPTALLAHVQDLMARDVKVAYLKSLQGYLWLRGYETGELQCPLFGDVLPAFARWSAAGMRIVIYSSGSVPAQKLLFQYTTEGDARKWVSGWYDTVNAGMKMERASYERIIQAESESGSGSGSGSSKVALVEPASWLFFSDRVEEVRAARAAGMRSRLVLREGNAFVEEEVRRELGAVSGFGGEEVSVNGV